MRVTDNPYRAAVRTKMLTNCQLWFKHHHWEFWQPTCILSHSSLFLAFSTIFFFTTNNRRKKTDPTLSNNKCTFKILGSIKSNTQSNSGARQGKQQPYDLSSITERILHHIWPKCPLCPAEPGLACEDGKLHISLLNSVLFYKPIHQLMSWEWQTGI